MAYNDTRSGTGAFGPERLGWANGSIQSLDVTGVVVEVNGARCTIQGFDRCAAVEGEMWWRLRVVSGGAWEAVGTVL